ncbi:MAG: radical SAM protein, partial [Clostridia bacterium]|nr:radical SAM protein [Clostridia bacterium]
MNLNKCSLCPNDCGIDRSLTTGACHVKDTLRIAKYYPHPFEEPLISGDKGSGTVFFCGCSLNCPFCQNYEVSRNLRGKDITVEELATVFSELQENGVHNINLVSPTHYSDKIIKALEIAKPKIPVVYNTHGYE